jgi:uncharacterized membrane protein YqgA involved in biofilm formation
MRGTLINVVAVLVGTGIGVSLGARLPERVRSTVLDMLGLFTIVLGVANAMDTFGGELAGVLGRSAVLVIIGALLVGAVIGELLDIEGRLARTGGWLQERARGARGARGDAARFIEGFVVASLVFCIGPLTILGALQDGLTGDYELLSIKSMLDGFAALAFASALGIGVGFSVVTILVFQGGIALSAGAVADVLTDPTLAAMNAIGGLLILGIGIRLLDIRQIRVANALPALAIAPLVVALWP